MWTSMLKGKGQGQDERVLTTMPTITFLFLSQHLLSIYVCGHWEYDSEQHIISTFQKLPSSNLIFQNFILLTRDDLYKSVLNNSVISIYLT